MPCCASAFRDSKNVLVNLLQFNIKKYGNGSSLPTHTHIESPFKAFIILFLPSCCCCFLFQNNLMKVLIIFSWYTVYTHTHTHTKSEREGTINRSVVWVVRAITFYNIHYIF